MVKKAPVKRPRFSVDPDLEIQVQGEVFYVHSLPIMTASPVFRGMLENDMIESQTGRITLPGKSKEEFREVLPWLGLATSVMGAVVTAENLLVLLKWANEYDIEPLQRACEQYRLQQPVDAEALKIAVQFRMAKRVEQCLGVISQDLGKCVCALGEFTDDPSIMEALWPVLFKAAGLSPPAEPLPVAPSVLQLWPVIQTAVTSTSPRITIKTLPGKKKHSRSKPAALLLSEP